MTTDLSALPAWHVEVLEWFAANQGRFFPKRPIDVGLSSVVSPKMYQGILRPASSSYAVSVYQSWKGTYPDESPIPWGDGTWTYVYHQEGPASEGPEIRATNRGLVECGVAGVPVGVMIPERLNGVRGYRVLGLARVDSHSNGCFVLTGPVPLTQRPNEASALAPVELIDFPCGAFDPECVDDERARVTAEVVRRQGQPQFRRDLLLAYEGRCCVSEYDAEPALEAAHIIGFRGPRTNHPENGLLLRADLHDLYDLGWLGIDPSSMRVVGAKRLAGTRYAELVGKSIRLPSDSRLRPNPVALRKHLDLSGLSA